jgi:hypothetical protein
VIVFKVHHCFSDGLGLGSFFLSLMPGKDGYNPEHLPGLKPMSCMKKMIVWVLYPFLVLKEGLSIALTPKNSNSIKKPIPMTGRKNGAFTIDLDINKIK